MRKSVLLTFLAFAFTLPLYAVSKNESYVSYDDGGTIIRTADDGREIEARVNLPVFPGDEVITNRRGRAEVRLADSNFLGIDRATAIRLRSVLNSYDVDANDTIVELRYGKVAVYRTDNASQSFRLDTDSASYFASEEAVFSVETDSGHRDRVQVFDGTIEVRTPSRATRLRSGESASVDDSGMYDLANDTRNSADDFERWFLARTEHYGNSDSRYLDRSLAYYDDDLTQHGAWTFVNGYGWGWRPYVGVGWRPYYNGQWVYSRHAGCLVWVSYEPWGWLPYHYGRWAYDALYGWFWLPGETYAPAWVYWMYSPGYIGWAPAGWYDCYRPYYDWAYRPYRSGIDFGFGFYGRVRINDIDLRPWTFIDSNTILSTRVDRAAVSADIVRGRLIREPGALATISGTPARFTPHDLQNPAGAVDAIYRGGMTGASGRTVPAPDLTPFFRRDPELPSLVRDRIVRTRPEGGSTARVPAGLAPIDGTHGLAPIDGTHGLAPIDGTRGVAPIDSGRINRGTPPPATTQPVETGRDNGGHINRGHNAPQPATPKNDTPAAPKPDSSYRGRIVRPAPAPSPSDAGTVTPPPPRNDWRGKLMDDQPAGTAPAAPSSGDRRRSIDRPSDVPRRVIDGIGGARIYRGHDAPPPPSSRAPEGRGSSTPPPPPPPRSNGGGSHRDSGGSHGGDHSSSGGHVDRGSKKD
ncbi:MAG TPA: DUF6600 domain-containing protein [Thermoanaerobaculia bacterium]|nr:DUF6600 domain-containing protein [Thermoanaerobaculia bacterium]